MSPTPIESNEDDLTIIETDGVYSLISNATGKLIPVTGGKQAAEDFRANWRRLHGLSITDGVPVNGVCITVQKKFYVNIPAEIDQHNVDAIWEYVIDNNTIDMPESFHDAHIDVEETQEFCDLGIK